MLASDDGLYNIPHVNYGNLEVFVSLASLSRTRSLVMRRQQTKSSFSNYGVLRHSLSLRLCSQCQKAAVASEFLMLRNTRPRGKSGVERRTNSGLTCFDERGRPERSSRDDVKVSLQAFLPAPTTQCPTTFSSSLGPPLTRTASEQHIIDVTGR